MQKFNLCTQLNFNFLHCLGLANVFSASQRVEIFGCVLLCNELSLLIWAARVNSAYAFTIDAKSAELGDQTPEHL